MTSTSTELAVVSAAEMVSRDVVDGWAPSFEVMQRLADEICHTEFVPEAYRGKPAAFLACIMTGRELGIGPMTSLKHVQLVKGTASLSAEYKRARILAAGHEFQVITHTSAVCTVRAKRRGQQWTEPLTYTIEMAKTAKLVKADGAWTTRPRRMLFARVTSEIADMYFPDLTMGLPTTELVLDGDWAEGEFTGQAIAADVVSNGSGPQESTDKPVRRRGRPAKPKAPAPELSPDEAGDPDSGLDADMDEAKDSDTAGQGDDDIVDAEIVDEPSGTDLAGPRTLRRIEVLFGEIGVSPKDQLTAGTIALGRKLEKLTGLSADEGGVMIDILTAAAKSAKPRETLRNLVTARRDERIAAEQAGQDGDDVPAPGEPF